MGTLTLSDQYAYLANALGRTSSARGKRPAGFKRPRARGRPTLSVARSWQFDCPAPRLQTSVRRH